MRKQRKTDELLKGKEAELLNIDYMLQQMVDSGDLTVEMVNGERMFDLTDKGTKEAIKILKKAVRKKDENNT